MKGSYRDIAKTRKGRAVALEQANRSQKTEDQGKNLIADMRRG